MATDEDSDSPLETVRGTVGEPTVEAFSVLGNQTRLAILLALWEAVDPLGGDNVVSFTDLRKTVGMRDSGQFHYHIEKLTGRFVEAVDDGYRLSSAGHQLVRTVIAGAGLDQSTLDPTRTDLPCPYCGDPLVVAYEDGLLKADCTDCGGGMEGDQHDESGVGGSVFRVQFDPAGLVNRSPDELIAANAVSSFKDFYSYVEGVCPTCTGSIDTQYRYCESHEPGDDGICPACGYRYELLLTYVCAVCKSNITTLPGNAHLTHPDAIAFFHRHDFTPIHNLTDVATIDHVMGIGTDIMDHDVVADDPIRVRVTYRYDDDQLHLLLDENANVVDVDEQ